MNQLILPMSLIAIAMALCACSPSSGPTFNAYSIDAGDGTKMYKVECGGLFETTTTCVKVAERICGDTRVQPVESMDRLRAPSDTTADPRTLMFRCAAPVAAKTLELFSLQSDALFAFNEASLESMRPEGKAELDKAIEHIKVHSRITDITIVGHTDRIGSDAVNQPLSLVRAETVGNYLVSHGLDRNLIHTRGVGSSEPVSDCPKGSSVAVIACLQPDRRVSVEVHGFD